MTARNEITAFQEVADYDPAIDLRTDVVMVYGLDETTRRRVADWRAAGYRVHVMTGISWGRYEDYLDGRWNGVEHWGDAQTDRHGAMIMHGPAVPYMVPTIDFTEYLLAQLRPLLDLDVEAVHLEEPEFWARGGYSRAFQREWQAFYGEPWVPPHSSPDAFFRSGRLMQHLFSRAVERIASALRDESIQRGREVRFYIPTHSLLNYTQWQIVSPESRLRTLPGVQGAVAQVWTGTARTANVYAGRRAERTLETAFLEYGIAQDLTRGTGRDLLVPARPHRGPRRAHLGRLLRQLPPHRRRLAPAPRDQSLRGGALALADLHQGVPPPRRERSAVARSSGVRDDLPRRHEHAARPGPAGDRALGLSPADRRVPRRQRHVPALVPG
ncbi:MAG: hypothetical protein QM713_10105 [Arachnia sp.]